MTFPLREIFFGPSGDGDDSDDAPHAPSQDRARLRIVHAAREHDDSTGLPDADLVAAVRAGDERRFEQWVREHAPALTRFAFDFVGTREAAEDVVADVFFWVWEHRTTWTVHGSVRGYLFGATRHRALNARRDSAYRARWIERHTDDAHAAGIASSRPDSFAALETQELGCLVRAAVDQLPERRRTVVILRWLHGMRYAEIAEATGTTVVGVKQQLNRALRDLRAALPDHVR